jgi:hypothetical protein
MLVVKVFLLILTKQQIHFAFTEALVIFNFGQSYISTAPKSFVLLITLIISMKAKTDF